MFTKIIHLIILTSILYEIKGSFLIDTIPEFTTDNNIDVFKSFMNDFLIQSPFDTEFKNLKWFSIGEPKIVSNSKRYQSGLLSFNSNGFYFYVEFLNSENRNLIKEKINDVYNINVQDEQIEELMLDKLKCHLKINCHENQVEFVGEPKGNKFPLKIEFKTNLNYTRSERYCLEDLLDKDDSDLDFECVGSLSTEETLRMDLDKFEEIANYFNFFEFCESVLITPKQLDKFSINLFNSLNISDYFNVTVDAFLQKFQQEFLKKQNFQYFDILEALTSLSKNSNNNLTKPYSIYYKLSNLIDVRKTSQSSAFKLILNSKLINELKHQSEILKELVEPLDKFFKNNQDFDGNSLTYSETDFYNLLSIVNKFPDNIIEWEMADESLIPKSVKLLKLVRNKFKNEKILFESFTREFHYFNKTFKLTLGSSKLNKNSQLIMDKTATANKNDLLELIQLKKVKSEPETKNMIKILQAHSQTISSLVSLPNNIFASSSKDGFIKLWHSKSAKLIKSLNIHKPIYNIISLKNPNELAVLVEPDYIKNHSIVILDINKEVYKIPLVGHTDFIKSFTLLENGNLASLSYDNTIKIWNTDTSELLMNIDLNQYQIELKSIKSLSNGNLICSTLDGIIILDINDGSIKKSFKNIFSENVLELKLNNNIAFNDNSNIIIIEPENGLIKNKLAGHNDFINSIIELPNGYIASSSSEIIIWDPIEGSIKKNLRNRHNQEITTMVWLDDGYLVTASADKSIIIWNIKNLILKP